MSSQLPAHPDASVPYIEADFLEVCRAIECRFLHNGTKKAAIKYLGEDKSKRLCEGTITEVAIDKPSFKFRDVAKQVFEISVPSSLFYIDWALTTGQEDDGDLLRKSIGLSQVHSDRLSALNERLVDLQAQGNAEAAEGRREKAAKRLPVNTHAGMKAQYVDNWSISDEIMKLFPRLVFPPRLTTTVQGSDAAVRSAGLTTDDTLAYLHEILTDALAMMKWSTGQTREREELCYRLKGNQSVLYIFSHWQGNEVGLSHRDAYYLSIEDFIARFPERHAIRFKLLQAHAVGPNATSLTDENALKHGIVASVMGEHAGFPKDSKTSRSGIKLVLHTGSKEIKSCVSPSAYEAVILQTPLPEFITSYKGNEIWKGGAAPATTLCLNSSPTVTQYPSASPVRSGGGPPTGCAPNQRAVREKSPKWNHPYLRFGAMIDDWVLDLLLKAIVVTHDTKAQVLFPDQVRALTKKSGVMAMAKEGVSIGDWPCIAPLLVQESHWVSLFITSNVIVIRDSDRNFTKDEAKSVAYAIKHHVPALSKAKVLCDQEWPQQEYGSADCALFVARAALQHLSGKPTAETLQLLSRKDIDAMIPAGPRSKAKLLQRDVLHQFHMRLAKHLDRPPPPLSEAELEPPQQLATPITSPVVLPSEGDAVGIHLPSTKLCCFNAHIGAACSKVLIPKKCITCCKCNELFCAKHAATWHNKKTWECQKCRPSWRTKGREHDPTVYSMPSPDPAEIAKAEADFQAGQGSPLLAHQAGLVIDELKVALKDLVIHPLASKGVSKDTRSDHQRMLNLLAHAPVHQRTWPIARVALDALERGRLKYKWGWITMGSKMGRMEGALNRLPLYTQDRLQPVRIRYHQEWKDAVSHIARLMAQYKATGLPSITEEELQQAIMTATSEDVKAILILSWAFVARVGDMSQVKTDCLILGSTKADGSMEVSAHFERGKVIGKIDPYTVATTITAQWVPFIQKWAQEKKTIFLFQMNSAAQRRKFIASVRQHLRTVRDDLDIRSIRRGAAQTMAKNKVPLETIRYFTRHADISMLRRYLKFGQAESEETKKGTAAGAAVWSKSS